MTKALALTSYFLTSSHMSSLEQTWIRYNCMQSAKTCLQGIDNLWRGCCHLQIVCHCEQFRILKEGYMTENFNGSTPAGCACVDFGGACNYVLQFSAAEPGWQIWSGKAWRAKLHCSISRRTCHANSRKVGLDPKFSDSGIVSLIFRLHRQWPGILVLVSISISIKSRQSCCECKEEGKTQDLPVNSSDVLPRNIAERNNWNMIWHCLFMPTRASTSYSMTKHPFSAIIACLLKLLEK